MIESALQRIIEQALTQAKVGQYIVLTIRDHDLPHVSLHDFLSPLDLPNKHPVGEYNANFPEINAIVKPIHPTVCNKCNGEKKVLRCGGIIYVPCPACSTQPPEYDNLTLQAMHEAMEPRTQNPENQKHVHLWDTSINGERRCCTCGLSSKT